MMKPTRLSVQSPEQIGALEELYHTTKDVRLRTRAQIVAYSTSVVFDSQVGILCSNVDMGHRIPTAFRRDSTAGKFSSFGIHEGK
jgi:hypothetical protein